ncbi:AAA family ATPase [candidate division KSB1 bacterium]|nr:AAA family ATPase [candidate division KSB1 bacterium]
MLTKEMLNKSPIRILEKTLQGGLGKGNLGVFTARKGVGKTATLVHMAIDRILGGERVLHLSFADDPQHIETWYLQVFNELAKAYRLENKMDSYNQLQKNRLIFHLKKTDLQFSLIRDGIEKLTTHTGFVPDIIITDGYPFDTVANDDLQHWKSLAADKKSEIWFSATLHRENMALDAEGIPFPVNRFKDLFSVIIMLQPAPEHTEFKLLKLHNTPDPDKLRLKLDPQTLLVSNYRV